MNTTFTGTAAVCIALLGLPAQSLADSDALAGANAANRELAQRGGRLSPRARAELAKAAMAEQAAQLDDAFLSTHLAQPGVIALPSGLQYRVLKAGTGKRAAANGAVRLRYQGTLIDGTGVDKADEKAPLLVAGLLPGLKEAVELMPAGSQWELVVPPLLAYGERGYRAVGPNAVLIYVIEVVAVI
jgi:FKBP-type peptidyl-prolyl cis-trans isomerase FklB